MWVRTKFSHKNVRIHNVSVVDLGVLIFSVRKGGLDSTTIMSNVPCIKIGDVKED